MPFLAPIGAAIVGSTAAAGASTAALAGIGALGVGAVGFAGATLLGGLGGGGSPELGQTPQAPTFAEAQTTSRAEAVQEQRQRLRGSKTTLTSPQGLLAPAQVTGKTLLGA